MMKQGELLRIGELAKEAGVSLTTVKFYAKEGLIRPRAQGPGGTWPITTAPV